MVLNPLEIGERIRKIREEIYHESRLLFAERCGLSENHLGKLENGTTTTANKVHPKNALTVNLERSVRPVPLLPV